jgi:hypothetical protein
LQARLSLSRDPTGLDIGDPAHEDQRRRLYETGKVLGNRSSRRAGSGDCSPAMASNAYRREQEDNDE